MPGCALQDDLLNGVVLGGMDITVQRGDSRMASLSDPLHPGPGLETPHIGVGVRSLIAQYSLARAAALAVVHGNLG
ncbi:hypothetical protein D3C81_1942580 [compost metagenome]